MSGTGEAGRGMEIMSGPLALHLLGILRAHEGRYDEAEEAFFGAIEAEPRMAVSYVELGLVSACRGEYRKMAEALRQAVAVGPGGVRAYLGERPLGDVPGDVAAGTTANGNGVASIVTAMAYMADGRDAEAAVVLKEAVKAKSSSPPLAVALLALAYLLHGEDVEADDSGVRRAAAAAGGLACDW